LFFAGSPCATVGEGVALLLKTTDGGGELEGPEEVVGFLEVGSDAPDLVNEVLNAGDTEFAEHAVNDFVVIEGNAGTVNLTVATSVDKLADGGTGRVAVSDKGLNVTNHVHGGLVDADENTVVELAETEKLGNLLLLGGELVDTAGTDNKGNLGLGLNKDGTILLGGTLIVNELLVSGGVFLGVLLGVSDGSGLLGGTFLLEFSALGSQGSEELGITSTLLDHVFRNNSTPMKNSM
jgi:hypothetical protein